VGQVQQGRADENIEFTGEMPLLKIMRASLPFRKETAMNKDTQKRPTLTPGANAMPTEQELLTQWGFTAEEIASLLWLRQWYQTGGSDRALMVRHLEFLRLLVQSGELEL
jgi:hypothetical protein